MDWDTCAIFHVRQLFDANDNDSFNGDAPEWDTSGVAVIGGVFWNTVPFDANSGDWDTRQVVQMSFMFSQAKVFD